MQFHFVEDDVLIRAIRRLVREDERDQMESSMRRFLDRQPEVPDLVGGKVAASIMGVYPPHITRLKDQGRLRPIPIEGSVDAYLRSEVQVVAEEMRLARERRGAS